MDLVHYTHPFAIDDLLARRLAVSKASKFNDPLELHFADPDPLTDLQQNQLMDRLRVNPKLPGPVVWPNAAGAIIEVMSSFRGRGPAMLDEHFRFLCCSQLPLKESEDILMWSHYAEKHSGVRLHLSESFQRRNGIDFHPINYLREPLKLRYEEFGHPGDSPFYDFMDKVVRSKSDAWAGEREHRATISTRIVTPGNPKDYIAISAKDVNRLDFGLRYEVQPQTIAELKKLYPNLQMYRVERCNHEYACCYNKVEISARRPRTRRGSWK